MWHVTDLNWVGVVAAAVAGLIIGIIWYAPQVFGKRWAAAAGVELLSPSRVPPMTIALSVVGALVTAFVLAVLIKAVGATSMADAGIVGFLAWLGFVVTWTLNAVTFERKPWMYWYINAGQGLVALVVMGEVIGFFN